MRIVDDPGPERAAKPCYSECEIASSKAAAQGLPRALQAMMQDWNWPPPNVYEHLAWQCKPLLVTIEEACRLLSVGPTTLHGLCNEGLLHKIYLNGPKLLLAEVEQLVADRAAMKAENRAKAAARAEAATRRRRKRP